MLRGFRVLLIVSLLVGLAPVLPAAAQPVLPPNCSLLPVPDSIEIYLICLPWPPTTPPPQFDLVVFAHGYVPPNETSMTKYIEQMILSDGTFLPSLANSLGYAFASTSYTKNGLAVREGLADTVRLIKHFEQQYPGVRYVYLVGASEGGLITTLAAEQPSPIDGGLALCGPIGSFRGQINYWGDFRVLFDYFYPHKCPPAQ
jgi:pimeloyl-ACP methyl ester carboxylesterase